ncbi:MAG: hypothetical protein Q8P45_02745 [Candidatus Harrisonbacteria bacterium]|nr:hypothetical protein [Candidatus Harrisonbacteria bacterium]
MKLKFFFLILLLTALVLPNFSQALLYYEYAPDPWNSQRFVVASANTVEQVFQPRQAIVLTGFDFWLDNTGSSGNAIFTLYNELGNILTSKSIAVSSLPPVPGGQKIHIELDQQIELSPFATYWIRISSDLGGLGLYQSSATTFLTHNEEDISPYLQGRARIDGVDENFVFKYALHRKAELDQEESPSEEEENISEEQQEEEENTNILIQNARVISVGPHSVTLAWSTNVAADSSAAIRRQLSPLYVVATGYDPALELEHTLTVYGLLSDVLYFADVFSTPAGSGEGPLTTYTIAFKTAAGGEDPPQEQTDEPQEEDEQLQEESSEEDDESQGDTEQASTAPLLPPPGISGGVGGSGDVTVSWLPSSSGEPSDGYRIDIFDINRNLERQIYVAAGIHGKIIPQLSPGTHHVLVYANNNQVFEKIATPFEFLVRKGINPGVWVGLGILLIIVASILFAFFKYKKEHPDTALELSST